MFTVALIGGDGSGKTTVAKSLERSSPLRIKYVYMGLSTRSSNLALPTSRLVLFLKRRAYKKSVLDSGQIPSGDIPADELEYKESKHGRIWACGRFLNRLAEAWYRQLVVLSYKRQGYTVLFDRHFFFDSAPDIVHFDAHDPLSLDRFYHWIMSHWYPRPDLTILLDASGELLYQRKKEASPEYLNRQRAAFLAQGKKLRNFVRVDATQPLEQVVEQVTQCILDFSISQRAQPGDDPHGALTGERSP